MMHTLSHNSTNESSGDVFISGKMWIFLVFLLSPGIWSVAKCDDSIVLPYVSLAVMLSDIMSVAIVLAASLSRCIFSPESAFARMFLLRECGGVLIQFIKIILGLIISI